MRDFGIRVITIQPGIHKTNFLNHLRNNFKECWERMDNSLKEIFGQHYYEKGKTISSKMRIL